MSYKAKVKRLKEKVRGRRQVEREEETDFERVEGERTLHPISPQLLEALLQLFDV